VDLPLTKTVEGVGFADNAPNACAAGRINVISRAAISEKRRILLFIL